MEKSYCPDVPMPNHQYKKPPIAEASCLVGFVPSQDWDISLRARLYERFKETYPARPKEQRSIHSEATGGSPEPGVSQFQTKHILRNRLLLPSNDGTRFVGIGPNELGIHVLPPYGGWEEFRQRIQESLDVCRGVVGPRGIGRIGIRYLNKIPIPGGNSELSRYLTKAPGYPEGIPVDGLTSFLSKIQCTYSEQSVRLEVTLADVVANAGEEPSVMLDIETVWMRWEDPLPMDEGLARIEDLKSKATVAFESYVTDTAREEFDAD